MPENDDSVLIELTHLLRDVIGDTNERLGAMECFLAQMAKSIKRLERARGKK